MDGFSIRDEVREYRDEFRKEIAELERKDRYIVEEQAWLKEQQKAATGKTADEIAEVLTDLAITLRNKKNWPVTASY
jgi:hypothetical protein